MRFAGLVLTGGLLLCLPAQFLAQDCPGATAALAVTPDTPIQPGDTITFSFDGPANAAVFLAIGTTEGSRTIGPFGQIPEFTLCLDRPALIPVGHTDSGGHHEFSMKVPAAADFPKSITLHLQAVFFSFTWGRGKFSIAIETSNTDTIIF